MYKVDISKEAQREIRKLPLDEIPGIGRKIHTLNYEPRPFGYKKLTGGKDVYRIPKGDYRIIYIINDKAKSVLVTHVRHRREAYRGLWF